MARVEWSKGALSDLDLIHDYLSQFDPVAADWIVRDALAAAAKLTDFPARGRPGTRGRRELPSVPPYLIRYTVAGEVVTIESVIHSAREPD